MIKLLDSAANLPEICLLKNSLFFEYQSKEFFKRHSWGKKEKRFVKTLASDIPGFEFYFCLLVAM